MAFGSPGNVASEESPGYRQGDHICTIYETAAEQLSVAARYVADGLARNERCLYVAHPMQALGAFREALARLDVDVDAAESSGALLVLPATSTHLVDGRFDCERMLALLNEAVEDALDAGFTGLRTCGDMSWLLEDAPGSNQVVEYEGLLNGFFPTMRALGMCQYDKSRLPEGLLDCAISTHTSVVIDGAHKINPFYRPWPFDYGLSAECAELQPKLAQLRAKTT